MIIHVRPATIMFSIIKELCPIDMIRFSLASHGAQAIVTDFMQKAFCTRSLVDGFMPIDLSPEFQALQQSTRLLASGSCGISFFIHEAFIGADFDVFIHSMFFDEVGAFLKKAGYGTGHCLGPYFPVAANENNLAFSNNAIVAVYEYVNDDEKKIQVVLCSHTPLDVLLSFHSSKYLCYYCRLCLMLPFIAVPMNFVGHDRAVSLYPRATFNLGVNYKRADSRPPAVAGHQKYTDHGWLPATMANTQDNTDHRDEDRWVSNRYCWVVPLPLECVPAGATDSIASHTWKLSYIGTDQGWSSQYALFKPKIGKPSYCISETIQTRLADVQFIWYGISLHLSLLSNAPKFLHGFPLFCSGISR